MSEEPIEYIIAQPEHEKPIYDYLQKHQRVQEPTMTAAKCTEEDLHPFMASLAEICSKNGVSYLALNVQQEIIGIRLNAPLQAWNDMMNAPPTEPPTERAQVTYDYVHVLENGYEKLMPNTCKNVLKFVMLGVRSDYQRRGIAAKMNELSFQMAKERNFDGITVIATAYGSQQLFLRQKFDVLKTVFHKYYLDKEGKRILNCDFNTDRGQLMFRLVELEEGE